MVITLGVAGFAFGDTAAEGRLVSLGLVGHNGAKPDVHGFVRCRTGLKFGICSRTRPAAVAATVISPFRVTGSPKTPTTPAQLFGSPNM
jgi:hypothetical protein